MTTQERTSLNDAIEREREKDREEGRFRTWEEIAEALRRGGDPVPRPFDELHPVLAALARMGRDANGALLHTERTSWLDENGVEDDDERQLFHLLFDAAEAERATFQSEQHEEMQNRMRR